MKFYQIFKTATIRQSFITTISIVLNGVLASVFYLLSAKSLGAVDYGLFSLSAITVAIMSVVFDFGNDKSMVKFISQYGQNDQKTKQFLKAIFTTKMASGIFFILLFTIFAKPLAAALYNQPEMTGLMPLTAVAFFTQLLLFFVSYYFQSIEKFYFWGFLFINANLIRLILFFILGYFNLLNAKTTLFLFALTPFISFVFGILKIKLDFIKVKIDRNVFSELFKFNRWAFGFSSISTLSSRIDTFLTSQYLNLQNVGVYGLATQATLIIPNLVSALGAVTSPKFARFKGNEENSGYLIKSMLFFSIISLGCAVTLTPLGYILLKFSGQEYLKGFTPFVILMASQIIFLAFSPLRDSILYFYTKPDFFFWTAIIQGLVTLISGVLFIPIYGLSGAALANFMGQLILNLLSVIKYLQLRQAKL